MELFDQLVGQQLHRSRHLDTERPPSYGYKFKFGRLFDGHVCGPGAAEKLDKLPSRYVRSCRCARSTASRNSRLFRRQWRRSA